MLTAAIFDLLATPDLLREVDGLTSFNVVASFNLTCTLLDEKLIVVHRTQNIRRSTFLTILVPR